MGRGLLFGVHGVFGSFTLLSFVFTKPRIAANCLSRYGTTALFLAILDIVNDAACAVVNAAALTVFSGLKKEEPLKSFLDLAAGITDIHGQLLPALERWAAFTRALAETNAPSFYRAVYEQALYDDNPFTRAAEKNGAETAAPLQTLARADLRRLSKIASLDIGGLVTEITGNLRAAGFAWEAETLAEEAASLAAAVRDAEHAPELFQKGRGEDALPALIGRLNTNGAGLLGKHRAFSWEAGALHPAVNADNIRLSDMAGYEDQRQVVIDNTLKFLAAKTGDPGAANNVLLYGDRGTGKSATVKAVCNEYAPRGLRLVELRKEDLGSLPALLRFLEGRGLKFVLFIDDLSFETGGDSFNSLKGLLEGGVETRPANVVIYATSNRRHLVKERQSDRPQSVQPQSAWQQSADDARSFDTMQEQLSLADRFGLTVIFTAPAQDEYLRIAEFIARQRGLPGVSGIGRGAATAVDEALLKFRENALRWERWFNGRSPRTARQYVDWISGGTEAFPWE
jgi:predicted AAA+ superfamily ATPase